MSSHAASTTFRSEAETEGFARWLAPQLRAGDVVLLQGDIGAGKSLLARAIILTRLAQPEDIPSPTFTLVQTYEDAKGCEIWHLDLYRLTHADEVLELGLDEAMETAICLIEWPDRYGDRWPADALMLTLSTTETLGERSLTATAAATRWAPVLDHLNAA